MHIHHIGIWTRDIDRLVRFYTDYFGASAGPEYENPRKGYRSRFLSFKTGATIEVATISGLMDKHPDAHRVGYAHLAMSTGSVESIDALTNRLREDGYEIVDGPRWTGDGYYESVVLDPDGNRIEITV